VRGDHRVHAAESPVSDTEWDAADMGCGELVLELRARLAALEPGQILTLVARDPGAPADIPAWCRMTGHTLVSERHPRYLIRKEP
jgi:tRNA 2-thiouridine synthesizing protein A